MSKFLILLSIVLSVSIGINLLLTQINKPKLQEQIANIIIQPVSAQELYPMFTCPCCGKPIDTDCCGMAKERKAFIDGLTEISILKEAAITSYIKKYGLDSFLDENKKEKFREKLVAEAPAERPIISIAPEFYDFGDISQAEGKASNLFEITNTGKTDLIINKLETSCGCTSASIIYKDEEGPIFGMSGHGGENSTDWQVVIPVGEKAYLKAYYDPDTHKDFRGTAIREIYVFSNDPIDFEKKVKIELNQVD